MLQTMRRFGQSWIYKGLMVILVASFVAWGIGDIFRSNPLRDTVAKAGSDSISVQQLNNEFQQTLARAQQMFGQNITAQQARQMGALDKALDDLIERALVDQEMQKLGIDVNAEAVIDRLAAQPQFRDKDGKFNAALFKQLLDQAHLTEHAFLEQGRRDLMRRQLIDVIQDDAKPPEPMIDALMKARGQKHYFDVVTIKNGGMTGLPAADDKKLQDFWQKNSHDFTSPEYRSMTIAMLKVDNVAQDISITDDDLRKEYDAKSDELNKPERRDIVQVLLQNEEEAKNIATAAQLDDNLAEVAKTMKHDPVKLPQADQSSLLPELAKPVFALQLNKVSDPIKSSLGWHIIQVTKIYPAGKPSFDEIKKDLREKMKRDMAIDSLTRMVNQLDDELGAGHSLDDIANSMKLRLVKIPAVDTHGKTVDGKIPSDFPHKEESLKFAFEQGSGESSSVMNDNQGNYYVVRTDEITPSTVKPYESVKASVLAQWTADQQNKKAAEQADAISKALRDGKSLSSITGDGIEVQTSKAISLLGDKDPIIPDSALQQIMKLKKGEVTVYAEPDQQLVIRLNKTADVNNAGNAAAKARLTTELEKAIPNELTSEYLGYLRTLFPVKINEDMMQVLRQQGS